MSHTPAPWISIENRIAEGEAAGLRVVTIGEEGAYRGGICRLQSAEHISGITGDELLANAALIVAAPDLLAALKQLRADYDSIAREFETSRGLPDWVCEKLAAADAVIAKAEGNL